MSARRLVAAVVTFGAAALAAPMPVSAHGLVARADLPIPDWLFTLKQRYGDRVEFIHQEVYVDNDPKKGIRESLGRFGVPTEPWLFTIDKKGRVAWRLEGSFGLNSFEKAVKAALARG